MDKKEMIINIKNDWRDDILQFSHKELKSTEIRDDLWEMYKKDLYDGAGYSQERRDVDDESSFIVTREDFYKIIDEVIKED